MQGAHEWKEKKINVLKYISTFFVDIRLGGKVFWPVVSTKLDYFFLILPKFAFIRFLSNHSKHAQLFTFLFIFSLSVFLPWREKTKKRQKDSQSTQPFFLKQIFPFSSHSVKIYERFSKSQRIHLLLTTSVVSDNEISQAQTVLNLYSKEI